MSRIRLTAALSIAITLIAGAGWFRFVGTQASKAGLIAVAKIEQAATENTFLDSILEAPKTTSTVSKASLSPTEAVSRQFFSDYISLSSKGKVGSEDLKSLAAKYASSIGSQQLEAKSVTITSVRQVSDLEENLMRYGQALSVLRDKYKSLVEKKQKDGNLGDINSASFKTFMGDMGKLYESSARELLTFAVPASLAENHLALVNNYLKSAVAMETLSRMDENPIVAYTAMTTQSKNTKEEAELLLNIQTTLMANGVTFERGI